MPGPELSTASAARWECRPLLVSVGHLCLVWRLGEPVWSQAAWVCIWICLLLAVCLWARHLTSLCHGFLLYKSGNDNGIYLVLDSSCCVTNCPKTMDFRQVSYLPLPYLLRVLDQVVIMRKQCLEHGVYLVNVSSPQSWVPMTFFSSKVT